MKDFLASFAYLVVLVDELLELLLGPDVSVSDIDGGKRGRGEEKAQRNLHCGTNCSAGEERKGKVFF